MPESQSGASPDRAGAVVREPVDLSQMRAWVNWGGNQRFDYKRLARPHDEAGIAELVAWARSRGHGVRVAGAGHSFSALVETEGVLADLSAMTGITGVDTANSLVSVGPATTIRELGPRLWEHGLALANQGDIDTQTIAGAVATATHGSGLAFTSMSGTVHSLRLLSGTGEVLTIGPETPELLHAAQVSLGLLGVVSELTLSVVDAYHLHERIRVLAHEQLLEEWDTLLERHRHFSFFWLPADGSAALYQLETPPGGDVADNCYVKLYDELTPAQPAETEVAVGERIDRAYRIYPHVFEPDWHELEYMVPLACAKDAFAAIRQLVRTTHPDKAFPVEVRFTKGEDAYLSPNYGGDSAVFSITGAPGADYWPWFRDFDATLDAFGARAHWGKLHLMTRQRLERAYPRYADFCRTRERLDPDGVFLNAHLRALFAE
jgi:FAD/FMN-containing dehydrogenase